MKKILWVAIGVVAMTTLSGCVVGPARHHSVGVDVGVGVSPVYVGPTVYREPVYYRPPVVQRVWIKQPKRDVHWDRSRGYRGDWGRGRGNSRGHR